jgi:glycosyltransferase involved in cell wall biosynthesis
VKVLHVEAGRHLYGGALQVLYLLEGLKTRGCDSVLVCPRGSAVASRARGLAGAVHAIPLHRDVDPLFPLRLRTVIARERPDLVHVHSRLGADVWGGLVARRLGVRCVLSRRNDNPEPGWFARWKYGLYDRVIAISEGIRQVLISEGVPENHVVPVRSAVDPAPYASPCDRAWFETEFGLSSGARTVGVIAQLIARKGHRHLLQAVPPVVRRFPEVRFILFGQGPLEGEIRRLCDTGAVTRYVQLAGFRSDLHRILPCLDLVAHPALIEGLGVSLLQAASSGVPIVGSRTGGVPEIVRDGVNGYLVAPGDSQALAGTIRRLLADPAKARTMGAAGHRLVETEFSLERMVDGNLRVYREVLGLGPDNPGPGPCHRSAGAPLA